MTPNPAPSPALDLNIMEAATLADMTSCVNHYRMYTPGVFVCVHAQVRLASGEVFTPGLLAQVNSGPHKQCEAGEYEFFSGPPNFVFDACRDDQRAEIERRVKCFGEAGVLEYVLWNTSTQKPTWLRRTEGRLVEVPLVAGGVIESTALPGLWVPVDAFLNRDWRSIMAATSTGITRRGHHDFMATIWRK